MQTILSAQGARDNAPSCYYYYINGAPYFRLVGVTIEQEGMVLLCVDHKITTQQTRDVKPMLFQCWPTVFDVGPTIKQHWFNVSRLLGMCRSYNRII